MRHVFLYFQTMFNYHQLKKANYLTPGKMVGFLPRAMLKGPKRSFVVVLLFVVVGVVETWVKNAANWTKNVHVQNLLQMEQKRLQKEQKLFANENFVQSDMTVA